jgi:hypothetical protein
LISNVPEEHIGYVRAVAQKNKSPYISAKGVSKVIIQKMMFIFTKRMKKRLKNIKESSGKERSKSKKIGLR